MKFLKNSLKYLISDKLGLYKGEEIELVLMDDAKPKFFQPRIISLVLKSKEKT